MPSPRLQYYIVETGRPEYTIIDMTRSPEYKALVDAEKRRELKSSHPTVVPQAALQQSEDMIYTDTHDEETGTTIKEFRDEVVVAKADSRGRLFFEKGQEDMVRKVLRRLRAIDSNVRLDETGLMLPEERPEGYAVNRGGRPPKKSV